MPFVLLPHTLPQDDGPPSFIDIFSNILRDEVPEDIHDGYVDEEVRSRPLIGRLSEWWAEQTADAIPSCMPQMDTGADEEADEAQSQVSEWLEERVRG